MSACAAASAAGRSTMRTVPRDCATQPRARRSARIFATPSRVARALSFNGLGNAFRIAAINGGRHVAPSFAGDTIYAWSEVKEKVALAERADVGALHLRTVAAKDQSCAEFPDVGTDGKPHPAAVLDLDYWVLMPR